MANRFGGADYQAVMAGSVLVSIPPLIVFLIFQKNFVRGIARLGVMYESAVRSAADTR